MPLRLQFRHVAVLISFITFVIIPSCLTVWYLYEKARDQFISITAFTVRSEDISAAIDVLGGLSALGSTSSKDSDILNEYISSREMVSLVNSKVDLKEMFSSGYSDDPIFSLSPDATIEDIIDYWSEMVKVFYDRNTGLIEVRVHAFTADDAFKLSNIILDLCFVKINTITSIARADSVEYAKQELEIAVKRLRSAREQITEFRILHQMVDLETEFGAQTGLVSALQAELSSLLIESDMLSNVGINDPRRAEMDRRIQIVRKRIDEERSTFYSNKRDNINFARILGEYEGLQVEREYAEQSYFAALAARDSAATEAMRTSRYLATYINPSIAERAEYPEREILFALVFIILLFSWITLILSYYALRDKL